MPEIRKDPVTGNCVIIATERSKRPHDFTRPYELKRSENCVFCYGNEDKTPPEVLAWRPQGGEPNSPGWTVRAFPNKFPAVTPDGDPVPFEAGISQVMAAVGAHEVVVDSPDHFGSLGRVSDEQAEQVLLALAERYKTLSQDSRVKYIQVFKNSGATAGASLEHTHWQIITVPVMPAAFLAEFAGVKQHQELNGTCIYCKIAADEIAGMERIVETTDEFVVCSPYASRFPFELWILPRKHEADFGCLNKSDLKSLGRLVRRTVRRLERAFNYPPYNLVVHTGPPEKGFDIFHWHIEILPRLSITAGFEWGTGIFINPTSPEMAAVTLREIDPDVRQDES
ncbi:MAG: galactose-1-phosphate uridylyltransferase [Eubacteriales bacterium]